MSNVFNTMARVAEGAAERALLEAAERAQRRAARREPRRVPKPQAGGDDAESGRAPRSGRIRPAGGPSAEEGEVAIVVHLSRLRAPAPRPHHRRIARALMQDVAQRQSGQVFTLRGGDVVLVCRATSGGRGDGASHDAAGLPAILVRLMRVDAAEPDRLVSVWSLDEQADALVDYARARLSEAAPLVLDETETTQVGAATASGFDRLGALMSDDAGIHDLLRRQTAILLTGGGNRPDTPQGSRAGGESPVASIRPLFREVTFSIAALEARLAAGGQPSADPYLFRHLAGRLDRRMLEVLLGELGRGGPLDPLAARDRGDGGATGDPLPPLHLNLTLGAVLSPSFSRFVSATAHSGPPSGIEVSVLEAIDDPRSFAAARARVAEAGLRLVLDGVSHLSLMMARPWLLRTDLLKLDWSPRLAELGREERARMTTALEQVGPRRVVLQRAETEAALRWALPFGIRRFQGRHVDAMLGASRIVACVRSGGCTLRQCIERAAATGPAGRAGCTNQTLLDAGSRPPVRAVPPSAPRGAEVSSRPAHTPHRDGRLAPTLAIDALASSR